MTIIYLFWLWFFSRLFVEVDSLELLIIGLIASLVTVDIWKLSRWFYERYDR